MNLKNKWWWCAFAAVAVIQLGLLFASIVRWERTLARGEVFKVRCEPIDPYDPFRGRYIRLNLPRPLVPAAEGDQFERDTPGFATIETGADGFAQFTALHGEPPREGAFVRCRITYRRLEGKYAIRLPFDRFFLNEKLAPEAELAMPEALRNREETEAWIQLRVHHGDAVIEEVFVNGRPIAEIAREALRSRTGAEKNQE